MPFQIIRNDITKVKVDAIVNTANPEPTFMAGTDAAIYHAAGEELLLSARKKIGRIAPGDVAVTPAFCLKAKYIIHTVGPAWIDGMHDEFDILRSCYMKSLSKAAELGCKSIAFPLIATGVYGFPKDQALQIAISEISSFLMREDTEMTIKLVVFDERAFVLSKNIFMQVESFIDNEEMRKAYYKEYGANVENEEEYRHIVERYGRRRKRNDELQLYHSIENRNKEQAKPGNSEAKTTGTSAFEVEEFMRDPSEELAFLNHLRSLLIEKNLDNVTVYNRANISKGAFSKIMCGDTKKPQKKTVLQLCIGLRLNLEESRDLLASADLAFNPYNKRDKLVIRFIADENYNIWELNAVLFVCNQPLLE